MHSYLKICSHDIGFVCVSKESNGHAILKTEPKHIYSKTGGFYMYTIIKDCPDVYTTKKFGDTSVPSYFFVLTSVPFRPHDVRT